MRYTGNYESYLEQRAAAEVTLIATAKSQQREIDRMQLFVDRFRAKNTKAAQAQSKMKQIERSRKTWWRCPDGDGPTVGFRFPQPQRSGHRVITLKKVKFGYGIKSDGLLTPSLSSIPNGGEGGRRPGEEVPRRQITNLIYENLNFECERGQRTVLVGPNGAGKSTLLKLLADVLQPQAGERKLGHNVKHGYFAQHRAAMLNPQSHGLAGSDGHAAAHHRTGHPQRAGQFSVSRRRHLQAGERLERRRKKPARAGQAAARSAESVADGRADDASRSGQRGRAHRGAGAISKAR